LAQDGGKWPVLHFGCFAPKGKSPLYHLYRRVGESQIQFGQFEEETNFMALMGIEQN
jgi:hypothetical protein